MEKMTLQYQQRKFESDYKTLMKCDTLPLNGEKSADGLVYILPATQTYFEFWQMGFKQTLNSEFKKPIVRHR